MSASIPTFFWASSSGRYFMRILNRLVARFLSSVLENWLMAGGTFRRFWSTRRARCNRTYFGHLAQGQERARNQLNRCPHFVAAMP